MHVSGMERLYLAVLHDTPYLTLVLNDATFWVFLGVFPWAVNWGMAYVVLLIHVNIMKVFSMVNLRSVKIIIGCF